VNLVAVFERWFDGSGREHEQRSSAMLSMVPTGMPAMVTRE
jgi:hypothetical protein